MDTLQLNMNESPQTFWEIDKTHSQVSVSLDPIKVIHIYVKFRTFKENNKTIEREQQCTNLAHRVLESAFEQHVDHP